MGAIIGDILGGILSGVIGFIINATKSTLFWGGDALICGIGNWIMSIFVNPTIATICGPIIGGGGAGLISGVVNFLGHILTQGLGEICNTVLHAIQSVLPK